MGVPGGCPKSRRGGVGSCSWLSSSLTWLKGLPERRWDWRGGTRTGARRGKVGPGAWEGWACRSRKDCRPPFSWNEYHTQAGLKGWEVGSP